MCQITDKPVLLHRWKLNLVISYVVAKALLQLRVFRKVKNSRERKEVLPDFSK